ncbi:MAG: insulinase family protein, partial [Vicinamibacterales bacterium]
MLRRAPLAIVLLVAAALCVPAASPMAQGTKPGTPIHAPTYPTPAPQAPTQKPAPKKPTQKPVPQKPAAATFPAEPPEPGTPRDFKVPEPKRFTLDNGLQVALVQWGTMPKVRVTMSARTGNAFEKENEVWLADLTGDLMREGTTTRTAAQISEEAARMGGSLTVAVGPDTTEMFGDVLSEYGDQFTALLA